MSVEDRLIQQELVDEIMKASEDYPNAILYMEALMENYERLKDNWNKLKECLNESKHEYRLRDNKDLQTYYEVCIQQINNILDKMQEIEGESDE